MLADMTMRLLTEQEAEAIYHDRMKDDFPPDELRSFPLLAQAYDRGCYAWYGAFSQDELLGYAYFVMGGENALLDYFAAARQARGQGIGSAMLSQFPRLLPETKRVLLEIEDPQEAAEPADRLLRERRQRFYMRNDVDLTPVRTRVFGVNYRIMAYALQDEPWDEETIRNGIQEQYRLILPREWYAQGLVEVCPD